MAKKFKLTLKRSLIGCSESQRKTVGCLGLTKINSSVVIEDNLANRGQVLKVQHLLSVSVEK